MAKSRKTGGKTGTKTSGDAQARAERVSRHMGESAQQIWLAGIGAFGRAQAEGARLFEALVKEGIEFERTARRMAGGGAEVVRDALESSVGHACERASGTLGRIEKVFEDRVRRTLVKLGIPDRDELDALGRRVETLSAELRRQTAGRATRKAPSKKAAAKAEPGAKAPAKRSKAAGSGAARKPRAVTGR